MTTIAATGPLSTPFRELAVLLAAVPALQTAMGGLTENQTFEAIEYPFALFDDDAFDGIAPAACVIADNAMNSQRKDNLGSQAGELLVGFFFEIDADYLNTAGDQVTDPKNNVLNFRNQLGDILNGLMALAGSPIPDGDAFYLNVTEWEKSVTPTICQAPAFPNGPYNYAEFQLHWIG